MNWFFLALLCAFSLASADAATKRWLSDYRGSDMVLIRFTVPALLLLPWFLLHPLPPVPPVFWGWVALLVPLELLAMWLYMVAIRDAPLHLTLPYLAFTPVFNVFTAWVLLGETVSKVGFLGILLVGGGAYLLNAGGGPAPWWMPLAAIVRERGSRLMLAAAAIYSLTSVMGKAVLAYVDPLSFGAFYYVFLGAVAALIYGARRPADLRLLWRRPASHLVVGALMAIMVVTHFLAIAGTEVAYMIAVKRTSLLFGIVYSGLLFREAGLGRHLFAGAVMVAGVVLILVGGKMG